MLAQAVDVQHYWAVDESTLPQITISRVMKSPRLVRGLIQLVRKLVDYTRFQRLLLNFLNPLNPRLHLRIKDTKNFCGRPGLVGLTLKWTVRHQALAAQLMLLVGCRRCIEAFDEAFHNATRIARERKDS